MRIPCVYWITHVAIAAAAVVLAGAGTASAADPDPVAVAPRSAAAASPEILFSAETSRYTTPAEPPAEPMVRFTDASGTVRMVRGFERVPPEFRALAADLSRANRGSLNRVDAVSPRHRWANPEPDVGPDRAEVVLYSSESCGACARARTHLRSRGISYRLRDIHTDPGAREEVEKILGRVVVPLLVVDGVYLSGFNAVAFDRIVERRTR